jgi:Cu(I)/Ag(I) efflux system membrane fusion protein
VEYVYPDVDPATRTVKVRFSVQNRNHKLRPGMIANVTVHGGPRRETVMVPGEAVIRTGSRDVVIVEEAGGRFRAQEVALGLDSGDEVEVREGLSAGERVVVSGQFLIDSEANLKGAINRLNAVQNRGETRGVQASAIEHVAEGTVISVDTAAGKLVIAHGPVATLDWPSMTMGFAVRDRALLESFKPQDAIEFRFVEGASGFEITTASRSNEGGKP